MSIDHQRYTVRLMIEDALSILTPSIVLALIIAYWDELSKWVMME